MSEKEDRMMPTVERGCGERVAGGVYLTVPLVAGGSAVEEFIIDAPQPINPVETGLSAIGTMIVPRKVDTGSRQFTTNYVLDIVGKEHYPNVADFVEEVRRFGLSRRIARNIDFTLLDSNSRIVLIHERAMILNSIDYMAARDPERIWCPRDIPQHMRPEYTSMCAALWWEDIREGEVAQGDEKLTHGSRMSSDHAGVMQHLQRGNPRAVVRTMPSFRYRGLRAPKDVKPIYQHAAFASFPIPKIEIIRDRAGGTHEEAYRKAKGAKDIQIEVVDE
jgi:hypothetical protein